MIPTTKRVNFIVLGAMKCGTTTLTEILKLHPEICFSQPKETNFFSKNADWKEKLDTYHRCFKKNSKIWGEGSTSYSKPIGYKQSIWNRIYEYNQEMKFIYIVRNPVDRIISHYSHNYARNRMVDQIDTQVLKSHFLNVSSYFKQISPYVQKFGAEKLLLLDFDDMVDSKLQVSKTMFDFLQLKSLHLPFNKIDTMHANNSTNTDIKSQLKRFKPGIKPLKTKPVVLPETRRKIIELLREDINSLEKLFGRDFSKWLRV